MKKLFFKILGLFKESDVEKITMFDGYFSISIKHDGKVYDLSVTEQMQCTDALTAE